MAAKLRSAAPKKPRGKGVPFAKGPDPRRNLKGRKPPKDLEALYALIDEIGAEVVEANGEQMEKMRVALNRLFLSKNVAGIIHLLDRRYGKVTDHIDVTSKGEKVSAIIGVTPIDYRAGLADLAPRPISDSDTPGEDQNAGDGSQVG